VTGRPNGGGYSLHNRIQAGSAQGAQVSGGAGAGTGRLAPATPAPPGPNALPSPAAPPQTKPDPVSVSSQEVAAWATLLGTPALQEIVNAVRSIMTETQGRLKEENDRRLAVLSEAQAGDDAAERELKVQIEQIVQHKRLMVPGYTQAQIVQAVFDVCWGMDVLAPIYRDRTVEEIRVNGPDMIYTVRLGVAVKEPIRFRDDSAIVRLIRRILLHDRVDITRDQPRVETTRRDGTRVTATVPPFTKSPTMCIRKFGSIRLAEESFLKYGTFNKRMARMLATLAKGRCSILLSGGTGTGKTTLLRLLVGYLPERLRLVTLESDFELNLIDYYPDRDIVALEAHPELGISLREAFKTILRYTPEVIIMGEARAEEADELVKAASRGHDGSMGTVHVSSVREVVPAVARMILEGNPSIPVQSLREQVATAFQIIVQLRRLPSGRKIVEEVCQLWLDNDSNQICYNTLIRWKPEGEDVEIGDWEFTGKITPELAEKMVMHGVTVSEMKEVDLL